MAVADLVVIAAVVLAGLVSLWLGVLRVVLGLGGWAGAVLATLYGFSHVRPIAAQWIETPLFADLAAAAALFVVSLILLTLLSHAITGRVRGAGLGALDRTLGLIAGLSLGVVAVCAGFVVLERVMQWPPGPEGRPEWVRAAKSAPLVELGARRLLALLPPEWQVADRIEPAAAAEKAEDAARKLMAPATESAAPPEKSGYNPRQRREMNRLIETRQ